jgi:tetratricopeptide (TPR) repeat protein
VTRGAAIWLALFLSLGGVARATPADDPDTEIARRHFETARTLYEHARYEEAIVEFEAARRARPVAELEYNIARCLDRLERWEQAIARYERYLAAAAPGPEKESVSARVAELRPRVDEARARALAEAPRRRPRWYVAPTVLGVAALALGGAGAGLVGSVAGPYRDLDVGACALGCPRSTYEHLENRAIAGYAVLGVAGAVAVVDVALWIALSRKVRPRTDR